MNQPLGRGLASLLKEEIAPVVINKGQDNVLLEDIIPGEMQPRKIFDPIKIRELADSIISNGLIQPIVVNRSFDGKYRIVAGERRYRACKLAGLREVPVIIKDLNDKAILETAIIENIQREELTAIEEAEAYQKLMNEFGYTQVDLANAVGKSRSHVANILRLNSLPIEIKNMVNEGALSMGHARCLIGVDNALEIANKIIANDLNVRQTEELTKRRNNTTKKPTGHTDGSSIENADDFILLGQTLSEKFGLKVVVENSWNGGKVVFHYSNLEELDSLLTRIK